MKGINAVLSIVAVFIDTDLNPFGTIAGNKPYGGSLLFCQLLEKHGEGTFPMTFVVPDNLAGIMVYYDSDILVVFSCAVKPPFQNAGYRRSKDEVLQIV